MKNISEFLFLIGVSIILCLSHIAIYVVNAQQYFGILRGLIAVIFIGSALVLLLAPIVKLVNKKSPLPAFFVSVVAIAVTSITLNHFGMTSEEIDFLIRKKSYQKILQNSSPIKTKSGNEITIVEVPSGFINVKKYLVLDKNEEFINPENKYFGLDGRRVVDDRGIEVVRDKKILTIKKYDNNIYIVDACLGEC